MPDSRKNASDVADPSALTLEVPRVAVRRERDGLYLLAICAVAFAVRLIYLRQIQTVVFFEYLIGDALAYAQWAERLAGGDWLDRAQGVFYQAPLYPYFLAILHAFGVHDLWWIRLVQIALGSAACGLVFLAGRSFFSRRVGILAGFGYALYAPAIFFDGLIQKEGLGQFWMTLLLWLIAGAMRRPVWWRMGAIGMTLGLLCLIRENALLFVPIVAVWLVLHFGNCSWRWRMGWGACFLSGLFAVFLPIGVRNAVVGGQFALTTSQAGPNFYIGNHSGADGAYEPLIAGRGDTPYERHDAVLLAERELGRELSAREVSQYWFGRAWSFVRDEPVDWIRLLGRKLWLVFHAYEIPDSEDMYYYAQHSSLLRVAAAGGHFGVLCPLAAAGIVLTLSRRRDLWILYALLGASVVGLVAFYVMARYRFPLMPIVVLFAAAAIVAVADAIRSRRFGSVGVAILALVAVGFAANWPLEDAGRGLAGAHSNAGSAWAAQGHFEQAVAEYESAVRLNPNHVRANYYLAKALGVSGRLDEAEAQFRVTLEMAPEDVLTLSGLATTLLQTGDVHEAIALAKHACSNANYADPEALDTLATAYLAAGQGPQAISMAERGLKIAEQMENPELIRRLRVRLDLCRAAQR